MLSDGALSSVHGFNRIPTKSGVACKITILKAVTTEDFAPPVLGEPRAAAICDRILGTYSCGQPVLRFGSSCSMTRRQSRERDMNTGFTLQMRQPWAVVTLAQEAFKMTADRRGGGRRSKMARKVGGINQLPWQNVNNTYAPMQLLDEERMEALHRSSMRILSELGIRVMSKRVMSLFEKAGAKSTAKVKRSASTKLWSWRR